MPNGWLGFGIPAPVHIAIPAELASKAALLAHLGVSQAELKKIWYNREKMYQSFDVAKKSGKRRLINAPDRRLKFLQRQIAELLDALYPIRKPVHGYVPGKSVKTNATSRSIAPRYLSGFRRDGIGALGRSLRACRSRFIPIRIESHAASSGSYPISWKLYRINLRARAAAMNI